MRLNMVPSNMLHCRIYKTESTVPMPTVTTASIAGKPEVITIQTYMLNQPWIFRIVAFRTRLEMLMTTLVNTAYGYRHRTIHRYVGWCSMTVVTEEK
jgi:hypothetical protein